jgi:hypothetical protein
MPVPGPKGEGIATLAQAAEDKSVLEQLKIDKLTYDITPEQVKSATIGLITPLSAVSSRMHFLQDTFLRARAWKGQALPSQVRVKLAEDAESAQATMQLAVRSVLKPEQVSFMPMGSSILRRFLPKDEGGSDTGQTFDVRRLQGLARSDSGGQAKLPREKLFQFEAVPWQDMPSLFREAQELGFDTLIGQRLRTIYAGPFLRALMDLDSPRDMVLRGRYSAAAPYLVKEQTQWQTVLNQPMPEPTEFMRGIASWLKDQAMPAYANLLRAKGTPEEANANAGFERVWKWGARDPMQTLMLRAIAVPRGAEVNYQLALCKYEEASRYQLGLDLATRAKRPHGSDAQAAERSWNDAQGFWREYLDAHATRPGAASARRYYAEALAKLGKRDEAIKQLQDVSAPMLELEKLACLWQAKQMQAPK